MKKLQLLLAALLVSFMGFGQFEDGINLNTSEALDGFVLLENRFGTYLVDNCGQVVHEWPTVQNTSHHSKLLPNGDLIYLRGRDIYIRNWDGDIVTFIENQDGSLSQEYEVIILPNGNYLMLGRRFYTEDQFIEFGFNLIGISPNVIDVVVERDKETFEIVWEWRLADHMIQERDSLAGNYGIVADNPQRLDIESILTFDWNFHESYMINGMDYNPELDQIALSVRKLSEVIIIDHSTTTEEAAGETGGRWGKGGAVLYRWGNPVNYRRGTIEDRKLFFQHNPNWITEGEHKGKLMIFNNGLNRPVQNIEDRFSQVVVIEPPVDSLGAYMLPQSQPFGPAEMAWSYVDTASLTNFYSGYTSGAKVLPNGNVFITEGQNERLMEVTPEGDRVWQFVIAQGNYIFRAEKYPRSYPAFEGRDLEPIGYVEFPPSEYDCELYLTSRAKDIQANKADCSVAYRASDKSLAVECSEIPVGSWRLFDAHGRLLKKERITAADQILQVPELVSGIYFVQLLSRQGSILYAEKISVISD